MTSPSPDATGADTDTIARVTALVTDIMRRQTPEPQTVGPTDSLTDAGVSSLDMVNLMLALEAAFDVFIPPELIKPSSFRSIASIATMVDGLRPTPVAMAS